MWAAGNRIRRRTGSFTLRCPLRTIGSAVAYPSYADMPLHMLLNSSLSSYLPLSSSDVCTGAVSSTVFTPTAAANLEVGQGISVEKNGRKEWAFVTDNAANVTHSPAFSAGVQNAELVRTAQTLFYRAGTLPSSSVCVELSGEGWRSYAFGCRVSSLRIAYPPSGAMVELTLQAGYITDDPVSGVVALDPVRANGARAHFKGSYAVITPSIGTTSPAALARTAVGLDEWSLSVDFTLVPIGHSNDIVGHSNLEVARATCELAMTLSTPSTTYDSDLWNQTQRSVLVGLGPVGGGNGAAIYLPAAIQQEDPLKRDLGGDTVRQRLRFRPGYWSLDTEAGAPADAPYDSPFRIALGL